MGLKAIANAETTRQNKSISTRESFCSEAIRRPVMTCILCYGETYPADLAETDLYNRKLRPYSGLMEAQGSECTVSRVGLEYVLTP